MNWFTSDTHFGHANIIKYCNRPFASVEDMDAALINKWNAVIDDDDTIYHLGDFTLGDEYQAREYFRQLKGKIFVLGNAWHHDSRWLLLHGLIGTSGKIAQEGQSIYFSASHHRVSILPALHVLEFPEYGSGGHSLGLTLCHYPLAVWDRAHYGSWHLFGHSHGQHENGGLSFDVGVDAHNFEPVSLTTVVWYMRERGWTKE